MFGELGVELRDQDCEVTMGYRCDEVVRYWYERFGWSGRSIDDVSLDLMMRVRVLMEERGRALPGVHRTLKLVRQAGVKMALASSSSMVLIEAVIKKLGIGDYFSVLCSAMDEARGKPDPAVFLTAARRLGVDPGLCLVFEDSMAGVEAGLAAGMTVVAVPAANLADDEVFSRAHVQLDTLDGFALDLVEIAGS